MCGICGQLLLRADGSVDPALIAAMRRRLRHRGPDDTGQFVSGRVGLGVTRLAIIDVEGGHQPVCNEDRTVWAVQNGEIYNYRELRDELVDAGHEFASRSDTEVLVHLYEQHGPSFVGELRGMFALAIWDAERGRLLLARDRLGIKPLFYVEYDGALSFASEIPAILELDMPRRVDPIALHDYLSFDYVPGPRTMFEGVRKLPPGHVLECRHRPKVRKFWDFPRQHEATEPPVLGDELTDGLRSRLESAVRAHLVSDVPVGAFLSGGLDSSIIVALMSRAMGSGVTTFSVGFREHSYNELPYASRVAELCGTDHHELVVEPHIEEVVTELVDCFGEPFADSSAVASYYVSQAASEQAKVVLSGDGGDEVFGGYVIYQADRLARWYRLLPPLVGLRLLPALAGLLPVSDKAMSFDLKARRFSENAARDPARAHGAWRAIFSEEMKAELYSNRHGEAAAAALPSGYASLDALESYFSGYPGGDLLNRLMYLDAKVSLVDDMLTKVDRTSMAHGLEVRVPLLDHQLVEWMALLPSDFKVRRLTLKYLLKQVAETLLPRDIVNRPKSGFHVPLPAWLKGELRPMVEEVLGERAVERQGVFDARYVRSLLDDHYRGRANYSRNIWGLVMFGLWHDRYIERR